MRMKNMKKVTSVILIFTFLAFNLISIVNTKTAHASSVLINENFDNYGKHGTVPTGWNIDSGISDYKWSGADYSAQFTSTGQKIETPTLSNPDQLSFFVMGIGTNSNSYLKIEQTSDGTNWSTLDIIKPISTRQSTLSYQLDSNTIKVKFTYTKSQGSVVFDDVNITAGSIPVAGLTLDKTTVSNLEIGTNSNPINASAQLAPTITPSNADNNVTWASNNNGVATVSSTGLVTAKGVGTATISATSVADSTKMATSTITVTAVPTFSQDIASRTAGPVTVTIAYSNNAIGKKYSINGGAWRDYTAPVAITQNGTIQAKAINVAGNDGTITSLAISNIDLSNGDWNAKNISLKNTQEAALMVRVGDINNFGFGWASGFNPFSGMSTSVHAYPWSPPNSLTSPLAGIDRIMVTSGYIYGSKFSNGSIINTDGYTKSTARPTNSPISIPIQYDLSGINVNNAILQLFVDDFQPGNAVGIPNGKPVSYQVTINGTRIPELETMINALDQSGPIGKLITLTVPSQYMDMVRTGNISLKFDDPTTGGGDGYAIDFIKLLINPLSLAQTGSVQGTVKDASTNLPIAGVNISAAGTVGVVTTNSNGIYILPSVPAGLAVVKASGNNYVDQTIQKDVLVGQASTLNFSLVSTLIPKVPHIYESPNTLTNQDVTVTITCDDNPTQVWYSLDNINWTQYTNSNGFKVSANTTVYAYEKNAGVNNIFYTGPTTSMSINNIDKSVPSAPTITQNPDNNTITNGQVALTVTIPQDETIMPGSLEYSTNTGLTYQPYSGPFAVTSNATIQARYKNTLGTQSMIATLTVSNIKPDATKLEEDITTPTKGPVTITATYPLNAVSKVYSVDGGINWLNYSGAFTVANNITVSAKSNDSYGVWSDITNLIISNIDNTPPTINLGTNGNLTYAKIQSSVVTVTDSNIDTNKLYYIWDTSSTEPLSSDSRWGTFVNGNTVSQASGNGNYYLHVKAVDLAGNETILTSNPFLLDNTSPTIVFGTNGNTIPAITQGTKVTVSDTNLDTDNLYYIWNTSSLDPLAGTTGWTAFVNGSTRTQANGDGNYYLHIKAVDLVGNEKIVTSNLFLLDNTKPDAPSFKLSTTALTKDNVNVTITYYGDSVVKQYSIIGSNGSWTDYGTLPVPITGNTIVYARGQDLAGNWSNTSHLGISNIDKTPPAPPTMTLNNSSQIVTITADPAEIGAITEYHINSDAWSDYDVNNKPHLNSNDTIYARTTDKASNVSGISKLSYTKQNLKLKISVSTNTIAKNIIYFDAYSSLASSIRSNLSGTGPTPLADGNVLTISNLHQKLVFSTTDKNVYYRIITRNNVSIVQLGIKAYALKSGGNANCVLEFTINSVSYVININIKSIAISGLQ